MSFQSEAADIYNSKKVQHLIRENPDSVEVIKRVIPELTCKVLSGEINQSQAELHIEAMVNGS